jgi:hypothetical protein
VRVSGVWYSSSHVYVLEGQGKEWREVRLRLRERWRDGMMVKFGRSGGSVTSGETVLQVKPMGKEGS